MCLLTKRVEVLVSLLSLDSGDCSYATCLTCDFGLCGHDASPHLRHCVSEVCFSLLREMFSVTFSSEVNFSIPLACVSLTSI